jgi:hypothetical protein
MTEINYSWTIHKLECAPIENELLNVVKVIHWTYSAEYEDKKTEISNQYPLRPPLPEDYINYDSLTFEIVTGWLENNLDVGYLKQYLSDQIDKLDIPALFLLQLHQLTQQ